MESTSSLPSISDFLKGRSDVSANECELLLAMKEIQLPYYRVLSVAKLEEALFILGAFFPPFKPRSIAVTVHTPDEPHEIGFAKMRKISRETHEFIVIDVKREFRRRRIGQWLFWGALSICTTLGVKELFIFNATQAGHRLFSSFGFPRFEIPEEKVKSPNKFRNGLNEAAQHQILYYYVPIREIAPLQEPTLRSSSKRAL
ncbi:MAG: GNAT family N-acetyltransferase [Candidatus Hodarchaeales archaeon]|jgi:N-acetylglutamate synthase-like GNAT family acetyltransferase